MSNDNKVVFRGTSYMRSVLAEDGKGNATQIAQVYRLFSGQGAVSEKTAQRILGKAEGITAALTAARVKRLVAFSNDPNPYTEQPKWVPESFGWVRAMDAVMDIFNGEDGDKVRRAIGKVATKVQGAILEQQRLSVDDKMEKFLGQPWVQEAMAEALGYEKTIVHLRDMVNQLRDKVATSAKEEVHPLARFYGGELIILWTDTDLAGKEQDEAVPYVETFPATFKVTRADCGEHPIYGTTEVDELYDYKCTVTQNGKEFVGYPTERSRASGNPATNCAIQAIRKVVEEHGGDRSTVSYNVKRTLYHWPVVKD